MNEPISMKSSPADVGVIEKYFDSRSEENVNRFLNKDQETQLEALKDLLLEKAKFELLVELRGWAADDGKDSDSFSVTLESLEDWVNLPGEAVKALLFDLCNDGEVSYAGRDSVRHNIMHIVLNRQFDADGVITI